MRVTVTNLEGRSQSAGAFFSSPTQGATIGGATLGGLTGISTSSNGNISVTASGSLTVSEAVSANGSGTVTFDAGANTFTQNAGAGVTIASGSGAISITTDNIVLNTSANTITSTGAITLQPSTVSTTMGLGGGAGTFNLTATELAALTDGFSGITIGRANSTGGMTVNAVTFTDPVTLQSPSGGAITVNGQITGSGNASVSTSGATTLNANIVTAGGAISIGGATTLGADVVVDTTNAGGTAAGANINFSSTINGAQLLDLYAGTGGTLTVNGAVGGGTPVQHFYVWSANLATLPAITTRDGGIFFGGTNVTLTGNIATNAVATAGPFFASSAITLGANVTINTDASATDNYAFFTNTINADAAGNNRTLTLITGTGTGYVDTQGAIGGVQALNAFTASGGSAYLWAITTGSGGINVTQTGAGLVFLSGALTTTSNGNISVVAATSLNVGVGHPISANGSGTVTLIATGASSDISTGSSIDSGSGLITLKAD